MWKIVEQQIAETLNQPFTVQSHHPIGGGEINATYEVAGEQHKFFVKVNDKPHLDMLAQECSGLEHLAATALVKTPRILCLGTSLKFSFLVLEWLELSQQASEQAWADAGAAIAKMHRSSEQAAYGFDQDNFIGNSPQPNSWQKSWDRFFAEQRIGWQLQLAQEQGISFGNIDAIVECARQMLRGHQPHPALLHGDLWRGNIAFAGDQPVIYDPAVYYGDRETDLAMSRLFGALPDPFYDGYDDEWPAPVDWPERERLYNLYHQLNHANMFKGQYIDEAARQIKLLLAY